MTFRLSRSWAVLAWAGLLALGALPAWGQLSQLDKTPLIEGLRKEGMGELLERMIQTEDIKDPILARQVLINQLLIAYARKAEMAAQASDGDAAARLRAEALASFAQAAQERRKLIQEFRDHEQRPLWQVDLAEQVIFEQLQTLGQSAAEFYELGVPTSEQKRMFEEAALAIYVNVVDAEARLFVLQGELPRRDDHTVKFVNTGLWPRMMEQYFKLRVPYFLAYGAYYVSLLPDSHTYYTNLGQGNIPLQKKTPGEERARLLDSAVAHLEGFVNDVADAQGVRRSATLLTTRVELARGRVDVALELVERVVSQSNSDLVDLVARLTKAMALDRKNQTPAALDLMTTLETHPLVKQNMLYRLLLVDARHRVLLRKAQAAAPDKQAEAIAQAYEPYQKLLADPALGPGVAAVRDYIYRRWESNIPAGADLANVPAPVVAAVGEIARTVGQGLEESAQAAEQEGQSDKADPLRKQAREKLSRSMQVNDALLERKGLSPAIHAQALFNKALALYYSDTRNLATHIKVAELFTQVAGQFPDQPMAGTCITDAARLLHAMHIQARSENVTAAYSRAMKVLLEKYPATKAADDERFYYATAVLAPSDQLEAAVETLARIPSGHDDYFPSQRELLYNLQRLFRAAQGPARDEAAKRLLTEAARVRQEVERARPSAGGAKLAAVRQAEGWARLILADLVLEYEIKPQDSAADRQAKLTRALALLEDTAHEFDEQRDLVRLMNEKRIVALFQVNELDKAVAEAERMMQAFPDDAAPVIDRVLTGIDQQVEDLRQQAVTSKLAEDREKLLGQVKQKAEAGVRLAELLRRWAAEPARQFSKEQLLPFELIYAKALRLSGRSDEALKVVEPLVREFPNNAEAMFNAAEGYFAGTDPQALIQRAAPLYNQIIARLRPENGQYPPMWWTAWVRRLQINDRLNQGVQDIPLRIRQLEAMDPNLGGPATKAEFGRLRNKHPG